MSASVSPSPSSAWADFAQKCSAHFGVSSERYLETALRRTLYPHAHWLRPLIAVVAPDFFSADRDFLHGVGQLWRRRDFSIEVQNFHHHPANRGFLRRVLRLRVSAGRVQTLVNTLLIDPPTYATGLTRASEREAARTV